MLFLTRFNIIPGKADEMFYKVKKMKIPEGVKIEKFVKLFGDIDLIVLYQASSEEAATEFILQFASCAEPHTSLCSEIEN